MTSFAPEASDGQSRALGTFEVTEAMSTATAEPPVKRQDDDAPPERRREPHAWLTAMVLPLAVGVRFF